MPSQIAPEQLLSPLSKSEIQLVQAYRSMDVGYRVPMLNMMEELAERSTAKKAPAKAILKLVAVSGQRMGGSHA